MWSCYICGYVLHVWTAFFNIIVFKACVFLNVRTLFELKLFQMSDVFCFCTVQCSTVPLVWECVTCCHVVLCVSVKSSGADSHVMLSVQQGFRTWLCFCHHDSDNITLVLEMEHNSGVFVPSGAAISLRFYWYLPWKLQDVCYRRFMNVASSIMEKLVVLFCTSSVITGNK